MLIRARMRRASKRQWMLEKLEGKASSVNKSLKRTMQMVKHHHNHLKISIDDET